MKQIIFCIVIVFSIFLFRQVAECNIIYLVPSGGEILVNEESDIITWVNSSTFNEFDIYLWNGTSCSWTSIETSVESSSYSWYIDMEEFGDRFRIKIQNSNDPEDYAFSTGYFSIVEPPEQFMDTEDNLITENPELKLYPNPATNTLNVELENHKIRSVFIWDMSGKLAFSLSKVNSSSCKSLIDELPNGEYFVECYSESGKRFTKKLVVRR